MPHLASSMLQAARKGIGHARVRGRTGRPVRQRSDSQHAKRGIPTVNSGQLYRVLLSSTKYIRFDVFLLHRVVSDMQ